MVKNLKLQCLELGNFIVENETHIDWYNILDAFEFLWVLELHPRLLRSQQWGDSDYGDCVIGTIFDSLNDDKFRACNMIEYILKNCTECDDNEINKYIDEICGKKSYLNPDKTTDEELKDLIDDINDSIASGKPVFALDRLHTLMQKYFKELCLKHGISFKEDDRLDGLFKKYVSHIKSYLDSKMTLSILKSSISLFSQYNDIRNNFTYAHDNNVLGDIESKLIFNNIVNVKNFIDELEEVIWS